MSLLVPAERYTLSHPATELKNKAELSQWERKENVGFIWGRKFLYSASSEDKDMKQVAKSWWGLLMPCSGFPVLLPQYMQDSSVSAFLGSETWHGREHHHPCQRGATAEITVTPFFFSHQRVSFADTEAILIHMRMIFPNMFIHIGSAWEMADISCQSEPNDEEMKVMKRKGMITWEEGLGEKANMNALGKTDMNLGTCAYLEIQIWTAPPQLSHTSIWFFPGVYLTLRFI